MDDLAGRQLLGAALDELTAFAGERDTRTEAVRSHGSGRNPFELDQRLLDLGADRAGAAKLRNTDIARFWQRDMQRGIRKGIPELGEARAIEALLRSDRNIILFRQVFAFHGGLGADA